MQCQICPVLYLSESIFIYFYIFCIFSIMFLVFVHSFIKCLVFFSFRSVYIFSKFKKYFSISAFVLLNQYLCLKDLKEVVLQEELHCQTSEGFFTYLLLQIPLLPQPYPLVILQLPSCPILPPEMDLYLGLECSQD